MGCSIERERKKSVWDAKTKFNPHLPQLVLIDALPEIYRKKVVQGSVRELAHSRSKFQTPLHCELSDSIPGKYDIYFSYLIAWPQPCYYRPQGWVSLGENVFGSVRLFVCVFVRVLLSEPCDP